jgi:hypothetical protein
VAATLARDAPAKSRADPPLPPPLAISSAASAAAAIAGFVAARLHLTGALMQVVPRLRRQRDRRLEDMPSYVFAAGVHE